MAITLTQSPPWAADAHINDVGAQTDKENYQNAPVANPKTDVSAEQYCTLARNATSALSTAAFAKVRVKGRDSAVLDPQVLAYKAMHAVGTSFAPDVTRISDGYYSVSWDSTYLDAYGMSGSLSLTMANATCYGTTAAFAVCKIAGPSTILVRAFDAAGSAVANAEIQLEVDCRGDQS